MSTEAKKLDRKTILMLAAKAEVDPRSIERAARGELVRGMSGDRARRVLLEEGFLAEPKVYVFEPETISASSPEEKVVPAKKKSRKRKS